MAALPDADRANLHADYMREASAARELIPLSKAELRAAFNGLDDYFEATKVAANNAIPEPARSSLSARQKLWLGSMVLRKRAAVTP